ncbi:MAG: hypothetical protein H6707_09960 [Deltaproteobacteria bacterium]|nr:hypothetical protein [Deltaproteobacteria bacterium]
MTVRMPGLAEIFWRVAHVPRPAGASDPRGASDSRMIVRQALSALASFGGTGEHPVANPSAAAASLARSTGEWASARSLSQWVADLGAKQDLSYASPEMLHGAAVDQRSLVFTVGVLLCERLTGSHPFGPDGDTRLDYLRRGDASLIGVETLPEELRSIIARALAIRPEDRFADLASFSAALVAYANAGGEDLSLDHLSGDQTLPYIEFDEDSATEVVQRKLPGVPRGSASTPANDEHVDRIGEQLFSDLTPIGTVAVDPVTSEVVAVAEHQGRRRQPTRGTARIVPPKPAPRRRWSRLLFLLLVLGGIGGASYVWRDRLATAAAGLFSGSTAASDARVSVESSARAKPPMVASSQAGADAATSPDAAVTTSSLADGAVRDSTPRDVKAVGRQIADGGQDLQAVGVAVLKRLENCLLPEVGRPFRVRLTLRKGTIVATFTSRPPWISDDHAQCVDTTLKGSAIAEFADKTGYLEWEFSLLPGRRIASEPRSRLR